MGSAHGDATRGIGITGGGRLSIKARDAGGIAKGL